MRTSHLRLHTAPSPARAAPCSTLRLRYLGNPCHSSNSSTSGYPATLPSDNSALPAPSASPALPGTLAISAMSTRTSQTPPPCDVASLRARVLAANLTELHKYLDPSLKITQVVLIVIWDCRRPQDQLRPLNKLLRCYDGLHTGSSDLPTP